MRELNYYDMTLIHGGQGNDSTSNQSLDSEHAINAMIIGYAGAAVGAIVVGCAATYSKPLQRVLGILAGVGVGACLGTYLSVQAYRILE